MIDYFVTLLYDVAAQPCILSKTCMFPFSSGAHCIPIIGFDQQFVCKVECQMVREQTCELL